MAAAPTPAADRDVASTEGAGGPGVAADPAGAGVTETAAAGGGETATGGAGRRAEGRGVKGIGTRGLAAAVLLMGAVAAARTGPEIEIRVSRKGFDPAEVTVRKGETTRVILSSADGEHCFAVDALRVEKRVVAGHPTTFDLVPQRTGRFPFYCCVETGEAATVELGEIVVIE